MRDRIKYLQGCISERDFLIGEEILLRRRAKNEIAKAMFKGKNEIITREDYIVTGRTESIMSYLNSQYFHSLDRQMIYSSNKVTRRCFLEHHDRKRKPPHPYSIILFRFVFDHQYLHISALCFDHSHQMNHHISVSDYSSKICISSNLKENKNLFFYILKNNVDIYSSRQST